MHYLVIGGSGRTGKLIIEAALSRSHTITALVRDPASLAPQPGLTVVRGNPLSASDVDRAFELHPDAIVVSLASVRASGSPFAAQVSPPTLMADAHATLLPAMRDHGVKRLVTMSALGVGASKEEMLCMMRLLFKHSNMRYGVEDHEAVEAMMREAEDVQWVGVKPVMLAEGDEKEVKVWGETGKGAGYMPSVTRKSVAGWLVDCAEGKREEWWGKTPVISN